MLKKDGTFDLNIGDDVVKGTVITHGGQVVHEATQKAMQPPPTIQPSPSPARVVSS
jgi:hypothetical protein